MFKGVLLEFLYGWARYMLVLAAAGTGVLVALQGDIVRTIALFAAAALLLRIDPKEKEAHESWKVIGGLVLIVFGVSGVVFPNA